MVERQDGVRMGAAGAGAGRGVVLDDSGPPDARSALGLVIGRAGRIDLAINGLRLAAIDFTPEDLGSVEHCRVVLGGFDIHALAGAVDAAAREPVHASNLSVLGRFVASGRVSIRSGGARHWSPDICVARGGALGRWFEDGAVALVGYLGLGTDHPFVGPRLTCVLGGAGPVGVVSAAFDRLWAAGHDVLSVVADALARAGRAGA